MFSFVQCLGLNLHDANTSDSHHKAGPPTLYKGSMPADRNDPRIVGLWDSDARGFRPDPSRENWAWMAGVERLELPTYAFGARRSTS